MHLIIQVLATATICQEAALGIKLCMVVLVGDCGSLLFISH